MKLPIVFVGLSVILNSAVSFRLQNYWFRNSISGLHPQSLVEDDILDIQSSNGVTVLKCEKLTKSFAEVYQFKDISFNLGRGQKVGLIGVNGAGKVSYFYL
jgi:ABC-type glutathione transport system ATPase component